MIHKLLIVDDEPRLTESFKALFEARGALVETALSGPDALARFRKNPFKTVLSDIQMNEMDGIELLHALKDIDPFVQVVFLTGYASVENATEALKQGKAFDYLKKPVKNFNTLYDTLDRAQDRYDELQHQLIRKKETEKGFAVFRNIFDGMEALVYVADIKTHELIYANKKFMEGVGCDAQKAMEGGKCWEIIQKGQEGPCSFCTNERLLLAYGSPAPPYVWEFYNNRNNRWYSIVDKAIEWYDKRMVRLETAFDITEKKEHEKLYRQFEKAIETSKKLESIGTLAGGVAHDFNNTLSTIIGNINLAQLGNLDKETRKFLQNAEAGVMQAKRISSKLITFARGGGPHKTQTDIADLVRKILAAKLDPNGIPYTLDCDRIPGHYFADQEQLKTAIGNILQNAMDSMTQHGRMGIAIRYMKEDRQTPRIAISISDTGSGISQDHMDMIFNPYFTTKPLGSRKSTGLGLSIAWSIITRHGGNIHVESVKDQGTTVHIFLPVFNNGDIETGTEADAGPKMETLPSSDDLKQVLVMDDEALTLDVVSQLLKRLGYRVTTASNGSQAVELFKTAMQQGRKTDIALLDYDVVGGLDGFQTLNALKEMDPGIIGLLMTGHSDHSEIKTYRQQGFSGLLEKPFSINQLKDKLAGLFT
ncbi:MAG: response regulator [Desulfobacula sp.]|nr:response regulator [Desulfobacula sp.]